jgi:hypothetical protein
VQHFHILTHEFSPILPRNHNDHEKILLRICHIEISTDIRYNNSIYHAAFSASAEDAPKAILILVGGCGRAF